MSNETKKLRTPKRKSTAGSYLISVNPEVLAASAIKKLRSAKDQLTSAEVKLVKIRGILNRPPTVTGWGTYYVIPWLETNKQFATKSEAEKVREDLVAETRRLRNVIREAEANVKSSSINSSSGGGGGGGAVNTPKTTEISYSDTVTYNVSAVKEAYFLSGQSFFNKADPDWNGKGATDRFDSDIYSRNTPAKVTKALELWTQGQAGKGMIQTWKPPGKTPAQYLDQNGNFAVLSDAKTIKRYGFQFLYNPGNISMSYGGVPDIDPSMMSSGMEDYSLANPSVYQSTINFEILLNRMFDIKYLAKDGSIKGGLSIDSLWPQNKPDASTLKQIRSKGTMYDVEFLLQTMFSYEPIRSQLRGKTSDVGYLGAFPVEMHLGNKLRYVAIIDSINVNHVIFTDDMVPMFTTVSISAKRIPDYKGGKATNGA